MDMAAAHTPITCDEGTDSKTWEHLYQEHFASVYRWIARLVGPGREDVEDLTQEVFLIVKRKYPQFQGRSSASTWILRIATKVAMQHLRKGRRRRVLRETFLGQGEPPASQTPLDLLERRESRELVYRVMDRLPTKKRTVLSLFEIQGLSGPEIAEIMECSVAMVWKRLHEGRKAFLKELRRITMRDRLQS